VASNVEFADSTGNRLGTSALAVQFLAPFRAGIKIGAALIAALGVVLFVSDSSALAGPVALIVALMLVFTVGRISIWAEREELLRDALLWRGMADHADPVKHFAVKNWSAWTSKESPPPFVRRTAMGLAQTALKDDRFVLLTGERISGKSRLIYELAKAEPATMTLVAKPAPTSLRDPLVELMRDQRALAVWDDRQILVLRDFTTRLIRGDFTSDFFEDWLERHPRVAVIATLNPADEARIEEAGEEVEISFEAIRSFARLVEINNRLAGAELDEAADAYPQLEYRQLEELPRYLVSEHPLQDRLESDNVEHGLARALVRACADWRRAGLRRPVPERFLRSVAKRDAATGTEDFESALNWGLEPVRGNASLIYETEPESGIRAFNPDRIVIELLDGGTNPAPIPETTWELIFEDVLKGPPQLSETGEWDDQELAGELIHIGEAALSRGHYEFGCDVLEKAGALGDETQDLRSAGALGSRTRLPSVRQMLIDSRRGDGIPKRMKEVQLLAHQRRRRALAREQSDAEEPSRWIAAIYRRRGLRAVVRGVTLMLADLFSASLGLVVGMLGRAWLSDDIDIPRLLRTFGLLLAPWGALTIFVFGFLTLYKQDAERARLGPIVFAMLVLAGIGVAAAGAQDLDPRTAVLPAFMGMLIAAFVDYRLRVIYDSVSSGWVTDHGLDSRTLLIGRPDQVAAVEAALKSKGISRPTKPIGYLTTSGGPGNPDNQPSVNWLGNVDQLPRVVIDHDIGRVLVADQKISSHERQALADRCHLRGLPVEAVPSPSDIQAGAAQFIPGQTLILVPMVPLWRGNLSFVVKRVIDFTLSLVALLLLSPLLFAIAFMIVLFDRQSPIVRSSRLGAGREVFGMYRFRTAPPNSKALVESGDAQRANFDTRLGSWLARRGLDELPQLFNVLLGDMSLVGPRPLPLIDHAKLTDIQQLRYVVKPGATSPWQVCERGRITYSELTAMDMAYLRHWTVLADLEIIVKTMRLVIRGRSDLPSLVPDGVATTGVR
jgi:lipopolysaccharide/colanic/teichoic acid biosynthesis glycosyltransferase